ncbi:MAG TPA: hypothetical protein VHF89_02710 [Solirubrobacteraceae bacterium]|nr:hypothetical protein [Solirubrobacteraceae bacterium]
MILLELLLVLVALALIAWAVLGVRTGRRARAARWRVVTKTAADGTLRVVIEGPGGGERVVKELPPGLEGPELTSELRLAREEAFMQAQELNREA